MLFSYCRTWTAQLNYMHNAVLCLLISQHVERYRIKTVKNSCPYKIYEYKNTTDVPLKIYSTSHLESFPSSLIHHLHLMLGQDKWFPLLLCSFLSWSQTHGPHNLCNLDLMVIEGQQFYSIYILELIARVLGNAEFTSVLKIVTL